MIQARFYDWVTVYQTHYQALPVVDAEIEIGQGADTFTLLPTVAEKVKSQTDLESGEVDYETLTALPVRGSYSTSLRIKCDGSTVYVDGNPSRFCRMDNLFGFQTLDECIAVYNRVLAQFGLPPFTKSTLAIHGSVADSAPVAKRLGRVIADGARFARLDVTINHALGSMADAHAYIRGLSSQTTRGKPGHLYPDGSAVDFFGGSRRTYLKLYIKALEMRAHALKGELSDSEREYLLQLVKYLEDVGCVREEHGFKSMKLKDEGCQIYGLFDEAKVSAMLEKSREFITRTNVALTDYQRVAETLLSSGLVESPRTAKRLQRLVNCWLNGENLTLSMSKTALYKARSELLPLGIDIKNPCDISRLMPRVRTVEMRPLQMPDFYRKANLADIVVLNQAA